MSHVSGPVRPLTWSCKAGLIIAWKQLHVFAVEGDRLTEHWAVRDDLRVIEAIDATR